MAAKNAVVSVVAAAAAAALGVAAYRAYQRRQELASIDVVKAVCLITIPLTILALVNSTSYWTSVLYAPMPMLLIAVVQSLEASRYTFKGACLGLFRALTGYVLAFGFFTFVVVLSYWY